jgi:DtxR family Mn-dependent transcriptional regulator
VVLSHGHVIDPHPTIGPEEQYVDELLEILGKTSESLPTEGFQAKYGLGGLTLPLLRKMEQDKLVVLSHGMIALTDEGAKMARERVRRHRLAEALFMGVLDEGAARGQESACRFEHLLNASIADAICTFLGHPKTCPHNKPIPRGPCCERSEA